MLFYFGANVIFLLVLFESNQMKWKIEKPDIKIHSFFAGIHREMTTDAFTEMCLQEQGNLCAIKNDYEAFFYSPNDSKIKYEL